MPQVIEQQGSPLGRLGKGIGKGLADTIPKEIDRYRLTSGLEKFEKESKGKSPFQKAIDFYKIPGITPQMIETFGQLSKEEGARESYTKKGGEKRQKVEAPTRGDLGQQDFANLSQRKATQPVSEQAERGQISNEPGQPQIVQQNPLRESAVPIPAWTSERRDQEISQVLEDRPGSTVQEAQAIAADNEARERAQPVGEQTKDEYFKKQQEEARTKFHGQLQTKLQKTGVDVFKDIIGESLVGLERGMERDLRTNPKASVDDVVNKWTTRALDFVKAKTNLKTLGENTNSLSMVLNNKALNNSLDEYQDIYDKAGNKEEFYNTLIDKFKMSPQGAAYKAYPRNDKIKKQIEGYKPNKFNTSYENISANSRKAAVDIEKLLTSDDSLLAIARDMSHKDPLFDQNAFFEQLGQDKDEIRLNARQRREIAEGAKGFFSNWADLLILPNNWSI